MTNLANILDDFMHSNPAGMLRVRPYLGQPWTDDGKRGQQEVKNITMRDIRDCFIRAFILSHDYDNPTNKKLIDEANKGELAALHISDIYLLKDDIDPVAVSQNLTCEIERIMGIFPNINESENHLNTGLPVDVPIYDIDFLDN